MKILLVGEYSAFAKELKKGFVTLGHESIIFSWGDGAKRIKQNSEDYSCDFVRNKGKIISILSRILMNIKLFFAIIKLSKLWRADACLIINPSFVRERKMIHHLGLTINQIKSLCAKDSKICLSACGDDYVFCTGINDLRLKRYYPCYSPERAKKMKKDFVRTEKIVSTVIPTHYDYAETYRRYRELFHTRLSPTIPLPIDVKAFKVNNVIGEKIVIFLGRMREEKGYKFMDEAVNIIQKKYSNIVRIPNQYLSIDEYLKELSRANIVLDQCTGFSYGMNSLYALAMGKCVLSNNEPEGQLEYNVVDEIPIINIKNNVDMIVKKLSILIENPQQIIELGKKARLFVEKMHDGPIIAQKYIEVFNSM